MGEFFGREIIIKKEKETPKETKEKSEKDEEEKERRIKYWRDYYQKRKED